MTAKLQRVSGETLERLRIASGLTEAQLGNEISVLGASRGHIPGWVIRQYEAETASPSSQRLAAMAAIFEYKTGQRVTVDSLYRTL